MAPAPPPVVDKVEVQGLVSVSEALVRSRIELRAGGVINPVVIQRDLRRLYELDLFTTIRVEYDLTPEGAVISYIFLEERIIDEILILGNKKLKDRKIRAELTWREGDAFFEEAHEEERAAVIAFYRSKGYLNAEVDFVAEYTAPNRVRLTYLITEGKKARIKSIDFHGNNALSNRKLNKVMKTGTGFWFMGGKYDEPRFENDLFLIQEAYANEGYLDVEVSHEFDYYRGGKKLAIQIFIEEGPRYRVGTIAIDNNFVFTDEEILEILEVAEGDIHKKDMITKDGQAVGKRYRDSGYVNAFVNQRGVLDSPRVTKNRDTQTTIIEYPIYEGDLNYVRDIRITGNSVTKDEVVRRHIQLKPGDRYDGTRLLTTKERLDRTQYFSNVNVSRQPVPNSDKFTDIAVDVEEGRTGNFNFGAGFNTDEGISGFGELALNNFDIRNFPTFDGGGQQFTARFSVGSVRNNFNLGFTDPHFLGYPVSFGVDVFSERYDSRGGTDFVQTTTGGQLRLAKSLSNILSIRTSARYTDVEITELGVFVDPSLRELQTPGSTASLSLGFTIDTSNSFRDPTKGALHEITLEGAGLGADNEFVKLSQDSRFFFGLESYPRWSLSLRERFGISAPYGDSTLVPLAERFYAGGGFTLRGYDTRDVGPQALTVRIEDGNPVLTKQRIGGELRLLGSAELKYKVNDLVRLYTFFDGGGVWLKPEDFDYQDFKFGVGAGIGVQVPFLGPIRFDYGYPINPDPDQGNGQFYFQTSVRF